MRLTYKNKIKYQYPVSLPASKSISNRLLILQFLFPDIQIEHLSNARDTAIMQRCLHDIKLKKKNIDVTGMNKKDDIQKWLQVLDNSKQILENSKKKLLSEAAAQIRNDK